MQWSATSRFSQSGVAALVVAVLSLWLAFGATSAVAAAPEEFLRFGGEGPGAGVVNNARGIDSDEGSPGHIFLADTNNSRVVEFTSRGDFVKAWGWGVRDGAAELQVCNGETGCQAGLAGSTVGQLDSPNGIAVDDAGDVYVFERPNHRVSKFNRDGEFLLMFGGDVNKTTGANVCTRADLEGGDECGIGVVGEGDGEFVNETFNDYLDVGPTDTIFVGDKGRIQEFGQDGSFQGEIAVEETVASLAIDEAGNFYVALNGAGVFNLSNVRKLAAGGGQGVPAVFEPVERPGSIVADDEGNIYVVDDPPGGALPEVWPRVLKFDPAGNKLIPSELEEEEREFFAQQGTTALTGLAFIRCDAGPALYVADRTGHIRAYGSDPKCDDSGPSSPEVTAQYATTVGLEEAVVQAEINPRFQATTYYVEYGLANCAANPCTAQPAPPGAPLGGSEGAPVTTAGVRLQGLEPGTTYHYRFVAVGDGAEPIHGEDMTLTTHRAGPLALPDSRAFEMVSPVDKNSGEVAPLGGTDNRLLQASRNGKALSYWSQTAFADPKGAPATSQYLSRRGGDGWTTQNITPPDQGGAAQGSAVRALSSDLSTAVLVVREPPLCCGAAPGVDNLYLLDTETGSLELITEQAPVLTIPKANYSITYGGASAGFERIVFAARGSLTGDAPPGNGWSLYEWGEMQGLQLISVLPDGAPAPPDEFTGFGAGGGNRATSIMRNAMSADGMRAFWTFGGEYEGAKRPLFASLGDSGSIQLDEGSPGPAGGGKYWAASKDGSKIFFTDILVENAAAEDLYRYDFDAPSGGEVVSLTGSGSAAQVLGVLDAADDGSRVYFVARGALAPGAEAGENNLYLWQEGDGLRFIDALAQGGSEGSGGDAATWSAFPQSHTPRVSPDGRHLAFLSIESLTDQDNLRQGSGEKTRQLYLYDAVADELICASCNPSGARPLGSAVLTSWAVSPEVPRHLSVDGGRLFFESFDALDPHDTNGMRDVYQFERAGHGDCEPASSAYSAKTNGCLSLISSGKSDEDSYFLDASANGSDVFISTAESLLPSTDSDELYDAYDARVGGGFPPPPPDPKDCADEAQCRGPQVLPPLLLAPGSLDPTASGNMPPGQGCALQGRRAKKLSNRARRLHRNAKKMNAPKRVRQARRKATRLSKRAKKLSNGAKRCRRAAAGVGR